MQTIYKISAFKFRKMLSFITQEFLQIDMGPLFEGAS
jgi:hypothetical protein